MINKTQKELWDIKDDMAKEFEYDMEKLVTYLRLKAKTGKEDISYIPEQTEAEQNTYKHP